MATHDCLKMIYSKRETRMFLDRPVETEVINRILEAGRLAGSAKNRQPWQFILIGDKENLEKLSSYGQFAQHLPSAAFAIVITIPDAYFQGRFDAGRAAQNMMLAAYILGLGSCPITLHNEEGAKTHLNIPEDQRIAICIAFGYPKPSKPLGKVIRKPIQEILHIEKYGNQPKS
ncbi:MAG: nitroreductase [Candidatus Caldarchaeum sp.]